MKDKGLTQTIAIIEDEEDILELIRFHAEKHGYLTKVFTHAEELYQYLKNNRPDLLILDIMLPDADGYDICRQIKNNKQFDEMAIIILSARGEEIDRVVGLELGADDYVTKPFSIRELMARIKAVLRRRNSVSSNMKNIAGRILVDPEKFECRVDDKVIGLTATEFKILDILSSHPGKVYTRKALLREVWDNQHVVERTIDVHVKNLRFKLGSAGKLIKNIRGIGYKIIP